MDSFLTTDEMKQYDIPFETDIKYYLDRIGYCLKDGDVVPCDDVEACDKVTASSDHQPKIPDGWDIVPEGDFDDGRWGCIAKEMPNNSGYYWIDAEEDEDRGKLYYTISYAYRTPEGPVGNIIETSKTYYRLGDALKEVDRRIAREFDDIEACDKVMASEDDEDEIYWVQAYYSKPHRGLADDFSTNDWDAAIEKLVVFANDGYYVMFENLASGEGYEYDPDEVLEAVEFGDIYTLRRLDSLYEG